MFNNSVFLKHGICDTVTVFLTLLPSLWTQEWAIGKGLYLLAQTNLQLLNASVQDCTWHCALRTVTFQKTDLFETCGSLGVQFDPTSPWVPWEPSRGGCCSQPGTGALEPLACPLVLRHWGLARSASRQSWVVPLGMWMELEDHILCCSPRRGTENLLLNPAALYSWF